MKITIPQMRRISELSKILDSAQAEKIIAILENDLKVTYSNIKAGKTKVANLLDFAERMGNERVQFWEYLKTKYSLSSIDDLILMDAEAEIDNLRNIRREFYSK